MERTLDLSCENRYDGARARGPRQRAAAGCGWGLEAGGAAARASTTGARRSSAASYAHYDLAPLLCKGFHMGRWHEIRLGPQEAATFGLLAVDVVCWLSFMVWGDPELSMQILVTTLCVFGIALCVGSLVLKRRGRR